MAALRRSGRAPFTTHPTFCGKSLQKCFREKSKKRYAFYERCDKIEDTRKEIGGDAP